MDRCYSGEVWRSPDGIEVLIVSGNGALDNGATARAANKVDDGERIFLPPHPRAAGWVRVCKSVD